jgi:hypothetical protein
MIQGKSNNISNRNCEIQFPIKPRAPIVFLLISIPNWSDEGRGSYNVTDGKCQIMSHLDVNRLFI